MDKSNPRLFLFGLLAIVIMLIYRAWLLDYGPQATDQPPAVSSQSSGTATSVQSSAQDAPLIAPREHSPESAANDAPSLTSPAPAPTPTTQAPTSADAPVVSELKLETPTTTANERFITVSTDVLQIKIDLLGGEIFEAKLPAYPVSTDKPDTPFTLFSRGDTHYFVAQSGITPLDNTDRELIQPLFSTAQTHYQLGAGQDSMNITLYWENESGLEVRRTLRFERGSYLILQEQHLINQRGSDWQGAFYQQLKRTPPAKKKGFMGARSFDGAAFLNEKKHYAKATFEQISKGEIPQLSLTSGWLAMLQHYFVSAWIPPQDLSYTLYTRHQPQGDFHFIGMHTQPVTVSAGSDHRFRSQLYVGPKTQDQLKTIAPLLERTVDYGKLTFIAEPLFYILKTINSVIGNWGWSIILLTTLIKLLFFKLSEKSYRSMANMRQLSPKLKQLKERYGEDKQKLNQAVMELYKKEKINPLGGCLPILIQMPVFISLYWMLLETVELRQAPFMFWIQDLSVRDPFFILPLIMGATMVLQQRLNPAPMDPTQQKVMMLMPIMFTGMFLFFPSGLVLYWVVNNTLSIAQQWLIIKRIENKKS